jgi:hypothetical protein
MSWSPDDSKYIAIMVAIAIAVAIGAAMVYFVFYMFALRRKVPVDEAHPFGVLCLSIQNADELLREDPKVANAAINHLNSIISRNLFRFGAIRSLRGGDVANSEHITIVGMEPADLIDLAIFIQDSVHKFGWGKNAGDGEMMEGIYHEFDDHYSMPRLPVDAYKAQWGGLRVRMALHFGYGTVTQRAGIGAAPQELGVDPHVYGGGVVKECLYVEEHAFGGQVLVSETFRELLSRGDAQSSSSTGSPTGNTSRKQSLASYTFIPSVNAQVNGKLFASQLELPAFPNRKHPASASAQNLTMADRSKSQKRAADFRKVDPGGLSVTASPDAKGETPNPMQQVRRTSETGGSSKVAGTSASRTNNSTVPRAGSSSSLKGGGGGWNAAPTTRQAQQPPLQRKESIVIYDDV